MLVLRINRRFWRSKPGGAPLTTSIAVAAIALAMPYSLLASVLKPNLTRPAPFGVRAVLEACEQSR
jgi:hypothetical protein